MKIFDDFLVSFLFGMIAVLEFFIYSGMIGVG